MAWKKWNRAPSKKSPKRSWSVEEMKMIGFVMKKGINISIFFLIHQPITFNSLSFQGLSAGFLLTDF